MTVVTDRQTCGCQDILIAVTDGGIFLSDGAATTRIWLALRHITAT
jgi:hypothetical protein